jgi:uncharacterized protein
VLKVLFNLAVVIIVGYIIYVKFFKKPKPEIKKEDNYKKDGGALMVSCEKCGTFVESGDSIAKDGKFYCSKECAEVR